MKKAVVLLSGGLDSTTCLAIAKEQGYQLYALSIAYGQRHQAELLAAKKIAQHYQVQEHRIIQIDMSSLGKSALLDASLPLPTASRDTDIPITYVPARNTLFLSLALSFAESIAGDAIFIGASAIDYSNYPDCRPVFIEAFQQVATLGTKVGVEGNPIQILAPLLHLSKAQTIQEGYRLGVDYSQTVSCYQAQDNGHACGNCASCHLRRNGFLTLGKGDPTLYFSA